MNKEFVPYEQALYLKELGFDEPCFGYYQQEWHDDGITQLEASLQMIVSKQHQHAFQLCSAPTYSAAFRWFREKYNIQGYIYSSTVRGNAEKTKQFTGYIWNINFIDMPFLSTYARDELHDTYEEAESACLDKLIEIIKEKTQ